MKFEDKRTFFKKLEAAATALGRKIGKDEGKVFFDSLIEYSIETVCAAIDKALRDRDPQDIYLTTKLLTVPEIRFAAITIMNESSDRSRSGCKECNYTSWILEKKDGRDVAVRCGCWVEIIAGGNKKGKKGGKK